MNVVLWDVGGTLAGRRIPVETSRAIALRAVGVDPAQLKPEAIERAVAHFTRTEDSWRTVADERAGLRRLAELFVEGIDGVDVDALGRHVADYFDGYAPTPGIHALLDELAGRGVTQGVVSNWPPSLRLFLKHHQLDRHLAVIVGSGEEGTKKPDPVLLELALARLGASAGDAVYIGDNVNNDIVPARALGMHAIHFDPFHRTPKADVRDVAALRGALLDLLALEPGPHLPGGSAGA